VGFALPTNTAVKVYNQIIKSGRVTRGSIGVSLRTELSPELLKVYGATQGAFVSAVTPGSPAEKAGLKEADIIVSMNGKPLATGDDLVNTVSEAPLNSQATLGVLRDGKKLDLRVTIADRTEVYAGDPRIAGRRPEQPSQADSVGMRFGFSVQGLSASDRSGAGIEGKTGVAITAVDPASFADDIGLQPGDILTEINRQPVTSPEDIRRIQSTLKPGDSAAFRVLRPTGQAARGNRQQPQQQWAAVYLAGTLPNKF
jgi:serine protease Do